MRLETPFVAAVVRSPFLSVVLMGSSQILEVLRFRASTDEIVAQRILRILGEHGATTVVCEPRSAVSRALRPYRVRLVERSLSRAIETLLPEGTRKTQGELCAHLVTRFPRLHRFLSFYAVSGRINLFDRWKTVTMLPLALGLAARFEAQGDRPEPETPAPSDPSHSAPYFSPHANAFLPPTPSRAPRGHAREAPRPHPPGPEVALDR